MVALKAMTVGAVYVYYELYSMAKYIAVPGDERRRYVVLSS